MAIRYAPTTDGFELEVLCEDGPVLVYFPASGPATENSRAIEAELKRFSERNPDFKIVNASPREADFFVSIDKLPAFWLFNDGAHIRHTAEFKTAEGLESWVRDFLPAPPPAAPRPKVVSLASRRPKP